jgi:lysyl-tRNA synthetase class 2
MEQLDFMEVETSTLNTVNSGANALPFTTRHHHLETDLFLRIAPELYLKRLLVGGYDKVFEIGRNYRNEGVSTRHNPEFTMMEFYEAYGSFPDLIDYTKSMLQHIDWYLEKHLKNNFAYPYYQEWKSKRTFTLSSFKEITMAEAVANACSKLDVTINGLNVRINNIGILELKKINVNALLDALEGCSSNGELTSILFEHLAEPFLTEDYREVIDGVSYSVPVFITQYPAEICPLARQNDQNPDVCDRFELFVDGRELCNAFQELNDPDEQARRFQEQLESNQKDPMGYDEDYVESLEYSMPPAIGFGIGIDRLAMLLTNSPSIKDVILFPTLKRENQ